MNTDFRHCHHLVTARSRVACFLAVHMGIDDTIISITDSTTFGKKSITICQVGADSDYRELGPSLTTFGAWRQRIEHIRRQEE